MRSAPFVLTVKTRFLILLLAFVCVVATGRAQGGPPPDAAAFKRADALFKAQNWAEARTAYDTARDQQKDWHSPAMRRAMEGAVTCSVKLAQWDEVIRRAEDYIAHNRDSREEAVGQRLLGDLYLVMPHFGAVQGDHVLRGEKREQSSSKDLHEEDQREAVRRLERARDLLAKRDADPALPAADHPAIHQEWIGTDFDLSTALARVGDSQVDLGGVNWWLGVMPPPEPEDTADDETTEERTRSYEASQRDFNEPPPGLPRGPDGQPRFVTMPPAYTPTLDPGEKVRFLLAEVERLDTSAHRDDAARAVFRRAMVARLFYGPDVYATWLQWWEKERSPSRPRPTRPPTPATKIWQLGDDQTLTVVGSHPEVVDLPPEESPLALLRALETRYPDSAVVPEARFARALYFQSRQQFPRALAEYRALLDKDPTNPNADGVRAQIKAIQQPDLKLGETGVHLAGERPRLAFTARNAERVEFTARPFDLLRYAEEPIPHEKGMARLFGDLDGRVFDDNVWKKYLGKEPVTWSETLPPGQENRAVEGSTLAPMTDPGAWIVEARVAGKKDPDRLLVVVTDILLVRKSLMHGTNDYSTLILACNARTGRPLPNRAMRVYEAGSEPTTADGKPSKDYLDQHTLITDQDGAVVYVRKHHHSSHVEAVMVGDGGRLAFSTFPSEIDFGEDNPRKEEDQRTAYLITDRPVYRPGTVAHFCLWLRRKRDGVYRPPTPESIKVEIYGPNNKKVQTVTVQTDAAGVASWDWTVDANAPLGGYGVNVGEEQDDWQVSNARFQVEEYRQPEFEVNVRPSTAQARLGEKFSATIEARYYFGAPMTQGKVSYKVYREIFDPAYFEPGPYDWIYGKGYGLVFYTYPWLDWWSAWGGLIGWGGDHPSRPAGNYINSPGWSPRELVAQGEADLGADGKYTVEVDTARARAEQGNHDHQYTIEATVRGLSRRAVDGQGSVAATRQEFYAYVETDRGWYAASNETRVQIRTLTPGNVPVAAHGEVVISRVRYNGPNHDEPTETEEKRWDAETGPDGRLAFIYPLPGEGQYHVSFRTHDSWKQEVQANAVFWVNGPKFDGRVYRFNELEIITDQRSYRVGETAHLLVNTAENDARLLFADRTASGFALQRYHFVDVPGRSLVVDVPIDESCVPNMFVEATVVRHGRVYTEACNLVVPPERGSIHLAVHTDKAAYEPGAKGTVHVEGTDAEGKPASGEVALTVFDKAVTYIAPEDDHSTPVVAFYGYPSDNEVSVDSSFDQKFTADDRSGDHLHPEDVGGENTPEGWDRGWHVGVGLPDTRLPRAIRDLESTVETAPLERVVITGSNIPSEPENPVPRYGAGADGSDAVLGKSTTPSAANPPPPPLDRLRVVDPSAKLVEPEIRTHFSDTALWVPSLKLDDKGAADAEITFPQGLTTWRVHGYAINAQTQVGEATTQATTTRRLIVRLLSPRFFTERDEVVLSAAVNSDLPDAQDVTAELILPAAQFQWTGDPATAPPAPDADGNLHLTARANVAPHTEHRFDWPVRALRPGLATITARALTGQESDGARLAFPVEVHGVDKTLVQSGSFGTGQEGDRALHLDIPAEADPEKTRLEITLSPSLAGVMIDALPYLADYPYGCVEQTVSRFYPSVLVRDTLKRLGTDLETVGNQRRQMNPADLASRFGESPVYDSARLERMIREGLASLYNSQREDGGWGWWGEDDASSIFQTAYVLQGLQAAKAAGVAVDDALYKRGYSYLRDTVKEELAKPRRKQQIGGDQSQAYLAYILSLEPANDDDGRESKWLDRLYAERGSLNNYGRALLALTLHHAHRTEQAQTTLRNLLQFVQRDDSNETAWVRTPDEGWWFWWNNDIETNAWALKALVALDPKNDLAPRLVKWLLNNRRGGSYWRSTRDTAQVISAMTDYLLASGESAPDTTLSVRIDGQPAREIHVTRDNLFTFDDRVQRQGMQLPPGPHEVVIHKAGSGALYYGCRLTYFTREEDVKSASNEIAVERTYAKLFSKTVPVQLPPTSAAPDEPGRVATRAGYTRVPLQEGDEVVSGDQIEVTLKITAKNTYDYLAFEDHKPAGCEPVEVRSGAKFADGFCANVELRDTKTVFFVSLLEQGEHLLRYRLRAETPGRFHALPATGAALYAPEVRANSDEMRLNVRD